MIKADIVYKISTKIGCSMNDAAEMLDSVFNIMKSTLEAGEKIQIKKFGVFEVKSMPEKKGRDPISGRSITIKARRIAKFRPSPVLKDFINR